MVQWTHALATFGIVGIVFQQLLTVADTVPPGVTSVGPPGIVIDPLTVVLLLAVGGCVVVAVQILGHSKVVRP